MSDVRDMDIQLDDMWMSESTHVLDLALDPGLGFGHVDDGLGDILHGDPLSSDGMRCHCQDHKKKGGGKASTGNEGTIAISLGRTLDFAKGAFGDVTNDGVLPEL